MLILNILLYDFEIYLFALWEHELKPFWKQITHENIWTYVSSLGYHITRSLQA